jgi:glycosyltransferase involved in cell wall biosynthesis
LPRTSAGSKNAAFVFLETTKISEAWVREANKFDVLLSGCHWNTKMLREKGVKEVFTAHQGVNTDIFKPSDDHYDLFRANSEKQGKDEKMVDKIFESGLLPSALQEKLDGADFVIFSGGKLEWRKGQDLVVAAFKNFQKQFGRPGKGTKKHKLLLVISWQNQWPENMGDITDAGLVEGVPRHETIDDPNRGSITTIFFKVRRRRRRGGGGGGGGRELLTAD